MLDTMHEFEHQGDDKHHEMSAMLAKAFVTPVDREDLAMISQSIDEVLDKLEEVLQRFYVDQIQRNHSGRHHLCLQSSMNCCELLKGIMEEFINFKKPAKLHEMVIKLNQIEEECDVLYLEATLNIRQHCSRRHRHHLLARDLRLYGRLRRRLRACGELCGAGGAEEHLRKCEF